MNLEFIKPDKRKILIFLMIFFIAPFPTFMFVDYGGTGWHFIPFSGPLVFFAGILTIIFEPKFYSQLQLITFILNMVVFPITSYLLSCLSIWIYDKAKKK